MAETLTHEAFTRYLQTNFDVQIGPDKTVGLQLTEISDFRQSERQEQFAIVFRGPNDAFLGQGTRLVQHEKLGQFEIFFVPISQDDEGYRYEAVFNRIRGADEPSA